MIDLGIIHHMPTDGNPVYIKQMHLPKGYYADTHSHKFDHYGLLGFGVATVELDGEVKEYVGPCVIDIKAGKKHKISALTDITWFCIHSTDEKDQDNIDSVLIRGK